MHNSSTQISHIGQISIAVSDLQQEISFYRDTLQLPLLFAAPPGLALFNCGTAGLMVTTLQGDPDENLPGIMTEKPQHD